MLGLKIRPHPPLKIISRKIHCVTTIIKNNTTQMLQLLTKFFAKFFVQEITKLTTQLIITFILSFFQTTIL